MFNVHRNKAGNGTKEKKTNNKRKGAYELKDGDVRTLQTLYKVETMHTLDKLGEHYAREAKDKKERVTAVEERDGVLADCVSLRNV
jgi:hypothetical protein